MKKILVLGANSGVAKEFCLLAIKRGYSIIIASRNIEKLKMLARDLEIRTNTKEIPCYEFDAEKYGTHESIFKKIIEEHEIYGCFIAVGVMYAQSDCLKNWNLSKKMMMTNYLGLTSIINIFASYLKERKTGFISCITSVAGDRGRQSNYAYGSSKAAMNTYLEGLRGHLNKEKIFVQTIKLGPVDTPMNIGAEKAPFMISSKRAVASILKSIEKRKEVVYVPWFWTCIMVIIRSIPNFIFKKLKI